MTRLVSAILARNEAGEDRYLKRVIERCKSFSDDVVLVDDNSTDDTASVAESLGCHVLRKTSGGGFWGASETPARKILWDAASKVASDGWVLICDADMLLEGDVRALTQSWDCAAWAWCLADCWDSEQTFRVDGAWQFGPQVPRPWLFRPSALQIAPRWREGCLHVGHSPENFSEAGSTFVAPSDVYWLHLGYVRKEHRAAKHAAYLRAAASLTPFERAHAESIADD